MATVTKAFSFTNSTVPYTAEGGSWAVTDGNKTTGSIVSGAESTNDPSGSAFGLQESITGKNSSNSGNFWEWTGTWENLGVPAGATVTNVQLTSDWRVPTYTTGAAGQVGPAEYRDSAGTLLGTFMAGSAFSSANATWATRTGSTLSVAAGQQASNTTIKLRLNNNLATGNSNSANVILQQDYIRVTVTYTGIPTPVSATIGAVIEAPQGLVMTQAVRIEAGQGLAVSEPSPIDTARVVAASATLSSFEANQKLASMKSHTLDALRQLLTTTGLATVESLSAIQMPSAVRSILDDFTGAAGPDLNFATEAEASRLIQRDGSGRATSVTDINHGFDGGEWPSLYGADQSVFVTVAAISGTGPGPALTLLARGQVLSAGTQSSYMARISQGASTADWSIQNPPAGFILVGSTTPIQVGDTYELRCVGSEISFWRKRGGFWEPLGVTNNTSLIASGHVGLFLQSSTSSTISVDNFGVGAITTTPLLEVDILREVASTNVDPYESQSAANIITRTALLALEALQRRAVSGGFGGETDQEIVKSTSASADVSRSLAIPGSSEPMEGLKQLAVQATEGADAQQALRITGGEILDTLQALRITGSEALDVLQRLGGASDTFGRADGSLTGGRQLNADTKIASAYSLPVNGLITSLSAYTIQDTSGDSNWRMGIYSDSGGNPSTLLAQSRVVLIPNGTASGYTTFPLDTPIHLAAGTYWLTAQVDVSAKRDPQNHSGAGTAKRASDTFSDGLATSFGAATDLAGEEYLFYANYTNDPVVVGLIDTTGAIVRTNQEIVDALKALAIVSGSDPIETLKSLTIAGNSDALEALRGLAIVGSGDPVDTTAVTGVTQTATSALDALQGLAAILSSPYESQGGLVAVSQSAALALESLRAVAATGVEPIDALRKLAITSPFVAELLRSIVQTFEGD